MMCESLDRSVALPDEQLVCAVGRGQRWALAELVQRHQRRVRALAFRITGRWELADDVAQDAFLRIHRSAPNYKPTAAFTTWLYRVVVNLCLDATRRPRLAGLDESCPLESGDDDSNSLERRERRQAIAEAVNRLPPRQRSVVILHRFEGLSHAQIAQVMECTEAAVESLLSRAYAELRQALAVWKDS